MKQFTPQMIVACEAAIDAGIFYESEFVKFVLAKMGGYDCKAVLLKEAFFDNGGDFEQLRKNISALESEVAAAPRGTYALLYFVRASDIRSYWKIAVSDGTGELAVGSKFGSYEEAPGADHVLERMIGYEIHLCRKYVEHLSEVKASQGAIEKHHIMAGMIIKNFTIPGRKPYSTVIVREVSKENGFVKLHLTKRGRKERYECSMQARFFAEYAGLNSTEPKQQSIEKLSLCFS